MKRPINNRYQTYKEDDINNYKKFKGKNLFSFYKLIYQRITVTPRRESKLACSPFKLKSPKSFMLEIKIEYSNEEFNENTDEAEYGSHIWHKYLKKLL